MKAPTMKGDVLIMILTSLSLYTKMVIPIHPPERTRKDPKLVDYSKHANDISPLRFQDPWKLPRNFFCDDRFWYAHQADWYESVIITKKLNSMPPFMLMMMRISCISHLEARGLRSLYLSLPHSLNFVVQKTTHFQPVCLHDSDEHEVSKMEFMYDKAYRDIHYGHPSGLIPYYKLMYLLFHNTLCPRGGNSDKISKYAHNILFQMAPNQPQFNACHYLWSEIIACSYQGSACHYAPYVFCNGQARIQD
jgi:hypothetical protein